MATFTSPLDFMHALDRYRFLMILNAAEACEEYQFIKQATMLWLVNYPGDLHVQYYQAISYAQISQLKQAISLLEGIIEKDPEFAEPVHKLSQLSISSEKKQTYSALAQYLKKDDVSPQLSLDWLDPLWSAREAYSKGDLEKTMVFVHQSLVQDPPSPIPAILHLKTAYKMESKEMLGNLSEIYHQKWPNCLQINIIKSLAEMDQAKDSTAVERLHWVVANDSSGQVIQQLMGTNHRFADLWPDRMEISFDLPIPASVSSQLGWNQLLAGTQIPPEFKQKQNLYVEPTQEVDDFTQEINVSTNEPILNSVTDKSMPETPQPEDSSSDWATDEDFEEIQTAFSRLAKRLKVPDLDRSDNRFPVYVIMTSKKQLVSLYGPNTATIIDDLLKQLVSLIGNLPNWGALLFYPDDPAGMLNLGLKPTMASDAWKVKLALTDLDNALAHHGEMIGALLVVGGPEIIPFHHLPNPTNDNDLDVPSDNPYGTIDENYFIPQWPVGRLPGETGPDAGLLLRQIRNIIYQYEQRSNKTKSGSFKVASLFHWFVQLFTQLHRTFNSKKSLGYSAEIWKQASASVYKTAGRVKDLQLSPPVINRTLALPSVQGHSLGYFNLHGVKDGPHWYGQKDFSSGSNGPDYPIALSPEMFSEKTPSPELIFTEACYGANVVHKKYDEALSLKSLDSGTTNFIGSSCIAYGSITPPLIAADFLAEMFWRQVMQGQAAGYALMQAKLTLAEEMTRKQGFLDGEDQKTILSFVLFGDPLAVYDGLKIMPNPLSRFKNHPSVRTISDSDLEPSDGSTKISKNVSKQVKKVVEKYLPGFETGQTQVSKSISYDKGINTDTFKPERYVVTVKKSVDQGELASHHHFARMTFDAKGNLVKFSTSR